MTSATELIDKSRSWLERRYWHGKLRRHCLSRYGLKLDPLQSDDAVVAPLQVTKQIQKKNKSMPDVFFGSGYRQAISYLEDLDRHGFKPAEMERILDFGVGAGRLLLHYAPFKARLYGCDVTEDALNWTRKILGHRAELSVTGLMPPLPYADDFFDFIYANSVFTHISFAAHERWIAEMRRIAKPGACVIVTVHEAPEFNALGGAQGWYERNPDRGIHMNIYFTKEKLFEVWGRHFTVLEYKSFAPEQGHLILKKEIRS